VIEGIDMPSKRKLSAVEHNKRYHTPHQIVVYVCAEYEGPAPPRSGRWTDRQTPF